MKQRLLQHLFENCETGETCKNAQNAKMNMALSKQRRNAEDEVCCSAITNCIKIAAVMGSRESNDGLHF